MPNYAMSVFLLPKELCKELEQIMNNLWWRSSNRRKNGIHWMCWKRLCIKKGEGGLGFFQIYDFNIAFLGKQRWRLLLYPDSLVARLYKARYYARSTFLDASMRGNPSYI